MEQAAPENQASPIDWAHLRVPPFPQVALKVLQLASDENVQLSKVGELISSDPAFAGEVRAIREFRSKLNLLIEEATATGASAPA